MVAVLADRQFAHIAAMGLVENPEIFGKTPRAHSNILSRMNLSVRPVGSPEQDRARGLLMWDASGNSAHIVTTNESNF
jgi:hypothetical protein